MSWSKEVEELEQRRELARQQGGSEAVAKQHERGRQSVRERVSQLVDKDSFQEHGGIAGVPQHDEEGRLTGYTPANESETMTLYIQGELTK